VRLDAVAHTGGLLRLGVDECDVGNVDGGLVGFDAARGRSALGLAHADVLLDVVDALDDDAVAVGEHLNDLALLAAVSAAGLGAARDDLHEVALFYLRHGQITSGASEMIFMNFLSRSSRPTGPKMRVPRGSPSLFRITAAFSSNLMYEPSGRRVCFFVRTRTALTMSPFFTLPPGIASFTVATMTSPSPA